MKRVVLFLFVMLFAAGLTNCAQQQADGKNITVKQLAEIMKNDSTVVVVDVRTPQELKGPLGKIDGVINIPLQQLQTRMNELNKYKDQKIYLICRTGRRSGIASKFLDEQGFYTANVLGGMTAYRQMK